MLVRVCSIVKRHLHGERTAGDHAHQQYLKNHNSLSYYNTEYSYMCIQHTKSKQHGYVQSTSHVSCAVKHVVSYSLASYGREQISEKLEFLEYIPCALWCAVLIPCVIHMSSCKTQTVAVNYYTEYSEHAFNCSLSLTIVAHPHTGMF